MRYGLPPVSTLAAFLRREALVAIQATGVNPLPPVEGRPQVSAWVADRVDGQWASTHPLIGAWRGAQAALAAAPSGPGLRSREAAELTARRAASPARDERIDLIRTALPGATPADGAVATARAAWRRLHPEAAAKADLLADYRRAAGPTFEGEERICTTLPNPLAGLAGSARSSTEEGWKQYGRQGHRRGTVSRTVSLAAPLRRLDLPLSLRGVDGLLTLDVLALPLPVGAPEGATCWSARWMTCGRGYALSCEDGVIFTASHQGSVVAVHGASPRSALLTWQRRTGTRPAAVAASPADEAARGEFRARLRGAVTIEDAAAVLDVPATAVAAVEVRRSDARAAGLCKAGTQDWINRRGLDGALQAIPLPALLALAAESGDRMDLVRSAIEAALWRVFGRVAARKAA